MALGVRASLVAGMPTEYVPHSPTADCESAYRRGKKLMCDSCKHGLHSLCTSEHCPCVCNDSDFRFARKGGAPPDQDLARVLRVRPELAELFR